MNREDIIRMAREAGFEQLGEGIEDWVCFTEEVQNFARLIAEDCAKRCDEEAQIRTKAGNTHSEDSESRGRCFAAARAAINCAAEIREAYKP